MDRLKDMTSFLVMDILKKAVGYPDVVHFEIGEPDVAPSPRVTQAMREALDGERVGYTEAMGMPELRERIALHYEQSFGVDIDPRRIAVTAGTSAAFLVAYSILLNDGDRIAIPDPGYPCYKNFAHLLDIRPAFIPIDASTGYQVTPDNLRAAGDVRALHISSPSNPLGNLHSADTLRSLCEYCDVHDITFISDEIYQGLVYEGEEHTALEFSENAVVINGLSKYFGLPGLRIGWMILPEHLVRRAEIVLQNVFICAPTLSQIGALSAFDYPYLEKTRETYRERRDYLAHELAGLFPIDAPPQGAFYIWVDISRYSDDCVDFAETLLNETHIAVTPGVDFGSNRTRRYLRFSYTREIAHMKEGIRRLKQFLQ